MDPFNLFISLHLYILTFLHLNVSTLHLTHLTTNMSKSQLQYDTELDPPRLFYTGRRRIRKGRPELQMAVECPSLDGTFTVEWLKERVKDRRVVEVFFILSVYLL